MNANPGCRCAKGQRHPAWIVQFAAGGRSHCRSVSKAKYEALDTRNALEKC